MFWQDASSTKIVGVPPMGKRFTDSEKWSDSWFRSLDCEHKLAWLYLQDKCDNAGVIHLDRKEANESVGDVVDWESFVKASQGRVKKLSDGKLWVTTFVEEHFGKHLNERSRVHQSVLKLMELHKLTVERMEAARESITWDAKKPGKRGRSTPPSQDQDIRAIVAERISDPGLEEVLFLWLDDKAERNDRYKPQGLKVLCTQMANRAAEVGVSAVREMVERAISNKWKGWDFGSAGGSQSFAQKRLENTVNAVSGWEPPED